MGKSGTMSDAHTMKENVRELALDMLISITEEQAFSHVLIKNVLDKYNYWDNRDKDFLKRLVEGTLERMIQLDYVLDQFSKTPVSQMKPLIRNLLRSGLYQILFMAVPDRAACNEAVKLAGKRGFRGLQGFVNGVLRNIARQKDAISWPDSGREPSQYLSVFYSMPLWLVEKWQAELGEEPTVNLLCGLLAIRPVTVRLRGNIKEKDKEVWLNQLKKAGVRAASHPYLDYAYELHHVAGVANLPGYAEGLFTVQDVSSMLVVEAAGIGSGDFLLDVCAAPGGKAVHGAERAARAEARDINVAKTALIREQMVRMKVDNMEITEHDARIPDEKMVAKADVLLADLPCSGLGIIGKKRDIKYKITPESLDDIVVLQRDILKTVWRYVKPGGLLIYSTCTISRAENEAMMEWFTAHYPFKRESFPDETKEPFTESRNGMLTLLPGRHPTDGFFICRLRRFEE